MSTRRDADQLHTRIQAVGLFVADAIEKLLHESLALLNSVTHADLASFLVSLDEIQTTQAQIRAGLDALTIQHAELLAELRAHNAESAAYRAGQAAAVAAFEARLAAMELADAG